MFSKIRKLTNLRERNDCGATATEYMIVLVLVAVLSIGLWRVFGETVKTALFDTNENVAGELNDYGTGEALSTDSP